MVLSGDYFSMPVDEVKDLESLLTMVGGKVVYAAGPYSQLDAPPPPVVARLAAGAALWRLPQEAAGPMPHGRAHRHPMIISDGGNWSIECPCGGI